MKLRLIGIAALSAMALTAIGISTASATTLEVSGVTKNEKVAFTASLAAGTTVVLSSTSGSLSNTCPESHMAGNTQAPYTGHIVTGPLTALSFSGCHVGPVVVHNPGKLYITWRENTTADLFSEEAVVTVPTTANPTTPLKCGTGEGRKIGTLHGVASGNASVVINAVIDCGFLLPTAKWTGEYTITSPDGLGISQ